MISTGAKKALAGGAFPAYFIQTKEGFYNAMLKHNIKGEVSPDVCVGSSLAFSDLAKFIPRLTEYKEKTGRHPLDYFSLLAPEEIGTKTAFNDKKSAPITLLNPYPSLLHKTKHPTLQGFTKTHTDYLIYGKQKSSQEEYFDLVKLLQPTFCVTPIEEVNTIECGKKRLKRVMKYSDDALNDFQELMKKDEQFGSQTQFLLPMVIEENERMIEKYDFANDSSSLSGVMLFGGQTMGLAAKHERLKDIKEFVKDKILALHQNQTSPAEIALLSLAGVDIFQTDYPFEAALEGKALTVKSVLQQDEDVIQKLLAKYKVQNELIKQDPALAISICAEKLDLKDPKM